MTDFIGVDPLPLTDKDLEARLPAARARSVRLAWPRGAAPTGSASTTAPGSSAG